MPLSVLVTGAAGRLGSEVCKVLIQAGHTVRAADLRYRNDLPVRLELADVLDARAVYPLVEGCQALIHAANHPGMHSSLPPQTVYAENVTMDINVFQAALDMGVRRIAFASSVQVIRGDRRSRGEQDGLARPSSLAYLPADGDLPACAANAYALSKVAGEMQLKFFAARHPDLAATAIRYPLLADPAHMHYFRSRSWERWMGYLDELFAYLSMADAARLAVAVIERQTPGYHCFLPAAPDPYLALPIPEIVRTYYPSVPLKVPLEQLKSLVDLSPIKRAVGWRPQDVRLFTTPAPH